jgi:hypothetical protein
VKPAPASLKELVKMKTLAKKLGLCFACLHCIGFVSVVLCIRRSADPQAPLLWGVFAIADLPISLLYMCVPQAYGDWVDSFGDGPIAQLLYFPHLLHGMLGTVWWYFLPRLLTPKSIGGVWGKAP